MGELTASLVISHRRNWDDKALWRLLTEEQLRQVQRTAETTSLRVVDAETGSDQ